MIQSCHGLEIFNIDKLFSGLRVGEISRAYIFSQGNKGKYLNNFWTALVRMVKNMYLTISQKKFIGLFY